MQVHMHAHTPTPTHTQVHMACCSVCIVIVRYFYCPCLALEAACRQHETTTLRKMQFRCWMELPKRTKWYNRGGDFHTAD